MFTVLAHSQCPSPQVVLSDLVWRSQVYLAVACLGLLFTKRPLKTALDMSISGGGGSSSVRSA